MQGRGRLLLKLIGTFAIIHFVQAQQGFINLDCGLPINESPYTEPSTSLVFSSDVDSIRSGKSGRIQKDFEVGLIKPYVFLRYFPDGARNCYNLNVVRDASYLIRAIFVYGNYDGLNNYPSFDLYLGPNKWGTINLEGKVNGTVEEIIHTPKSNSLQICLVKTKTTPFISALELRPLRNGTYTTQNGSLKHLFRRYHSPSQRLIRYPDDVLDRNWSPFFLPEWTQITTNLDVNNSNNYIPPKAALTTAASPTNGSTLTIKWTLDNPNDQVHLYIHFAELKPVPPNDNSGVIDLLTVFGRTFNVMVNGNVTYALYRPKDLRVDTKNATLSKCDGGKCSLQLVKYPGAQIPPLVNAIEAFTVIELPQSETNPDDVTAIKNIQATYGLSSISWQGDPCVPQLFLWNGLNCSSYPNTSVPPRIISLDLSSRGLSGTIAPDIQSLTQLQELDLSNNDLTGDVPEFLGNMNSLLVVNLSGNNLHGVIPQALLDRKKGGLKLDVDGNPKLCQSSSCRIPDGGNNKRKFLLPVIVAIALLAVSMVALVLIFVFRKKRPSRVRALRLSLTNPSIETKKRRFTYSEIRAITNNFQRVIGEGGFGIVYHGYLNNTEQVAVKVLSLSSTQGYKQFKAEVELLRRVHHINLVSLIGYCDEQDHVALIYEYIVNGDLKEHLSGKRGGCVLNWANRLRIAVDAAQGLEYLHSGCKPPMVHRDVKSMNILVDEKFQAKLADFGLSRSFSVGGESHVTTVIAGTPGYLDPEYYKTNWLTEKSDVYSFGVVLLEIITNRPVIEQARERPHLPDWVELMLESGDITTIVDPKLEEDYDSGSVWKALELARSCMNPSSVARPNMSQVVHDLKECLKSENSRTGASRDTDSKSSIELSTSFRTEATPTAR